jgi:nucleotide-binding universal stress UspA family protein
MNTISQAPTGAWSAKSVQNLTMLEGGTFPKTIERIVVVTDLSAESRQAITVAANFANKFNAKLMLLYVHEPFYFAACAADSKRADDGRELQAEAEARLMGLVARTRASCSDTEPGFRVGSPLAQIVLAATEWSADLLIMSAHQSEQNLAANISHYAPCPILIARRSPGDPDLGWAGM